MIELERGPKFWDSAGPGRETAEQVAFSMEVWQLIYGIGYDVANTGTYPITHGTELNWAVMQ